MEVADMPTKPTAKTAPKKPLPELSLVGRCFHVFGENQKVQYQGIVRGMVNDTHALVQYFEWFMGEANTFEVVSVKRMSKGATVDNRAPGSWQFYEDNQQMNDWYENHPHTKAD
jgi:cobalamin biosynthesis Mg chelatase CobN